MKDESNLIIAAKKEEEGAFLLFHTSSNWGQPYFATTITMASHLVSDQVFRPYPSLFPSRPTDTAINTLVKHGVCDPTEEAVAVPKIHGANFQASFNVRRVFALV